LIDCRIFVMEDFGIVISVKNFSPSHNLIHESDRG
jgi:hypothetical protein